MLGQGRGTQQRKFGYVLQSLQAFLLMKAEITYSAIGNWTKKKKKSTKPIYSSAAAVLLLLHLWLSKKHWKTPLQAVNGAFLWEYSGFGGPDLGYVSVADFGWLQQMMGSVARLPSLYLVKVCEAKAS